MEIDDGTAEKKVRKQPEKEDNYKTILGTKLTPNVSYSFVVST